MRLTFLTVIPSPYQRELFCALADSGAFELRVFYYAASARDRQWNSERLAAFETILDGRTLHFLGDSAHLNPSIGRILRRSEADLFIVSDYSAPTAQLAMRYLSAERRRWLFWGEIPGLHSRGKFGTFLRNRLQSPIKGATGIAAIGRRAAAIYERLFPGLPVFDIPYFCDLAPFEAAADSAGRKPSTSVEVLFSGQLIARKGADILLEAFLKSLDRAPHMRLLLLGDGPERSRLAAKIPPSLRDRVVFLGFRNPREIPTIFAGSDFLVLPSRHDGWGVVLNEALGAGLPIIASDRVEAAHELVQEGVNGFITPAGDPVALAEAMTTLACSPSMRTLFAQASCQLRAKWGLDIAVSRWLEVCDKLVTSKVEA